jgi:hypothetical protein
MAPRWLLCVLTLLLPVTVGAHAAPKVAVFPLEVVEPVGDGFSLPKKNVAEAARIKLATEELSKALAASGRFEVVDLSAMAKEIADKAPLYKCNGCETDLAKKAGAEIAVVGIIDKGSETLLNMAIELHDADTGKVRRAGSIVVQGNTDEMWLRSVRWLVKNRLLEEAAPR